MERRKGGYTLLDLIVGIMILVIAVGAVSTSLTSGFSLNRSNSERAIAIQFAEGVLERIRATEFEEIYARYNATAADDPADGISPGASFTVQGLRPVEGDPDGIVGEVRFPGDGTLLLEDEVDRNLGLPRDLNADGVVDGLDHSGDYAVLPVQVSVSWRGANGPHRVDLFFSVARR